MYVGDENVELASITWESTSCSWIRIFYAPPTCLDNHAHLYTRLLFGWRVSMGLSRSTDKLSTPRQYHDFVRRELQRHLMDQEDALILWVVSTRPTVIEPFDKIYKFGETPTIKSLVVIKKQTVDLLI